MRVALTFDAEHPDRSHCPPGNEQGLLDTLSREGVRATFFLQGRWVLSHPDPARRVADEGHLVGNHSHYHSRMRLLTAEGFRTDVLSAERAIAEVVGVDPRPWFRLPFGSGHRDERLTRLLEGLGYRNVGWDVDAFDWDETRSAKEMEASVVEATLACGAGAIVLMHGWPATTVQALPGIIGGLRDRGATLCALDDWPEAPTTTASTPNEGATLAELVGERERSVGQRVAGASTRPRGGETRPRRAGNPLL
jgi:peptidoglycan-N-acetylglucosamine deacetylase